MLEINEALVTRLLEIVDVGLCRGKGVPEAGKMCVEAAVCYVLGEDHGDKPSCVAPAVRSFKIRLNDATWSSNAARAKGMRRVAVAQLGSLDIDQVVFVKYVAEQTIRRIVPIALRAIGLETEAVLCETEGTKKAVIVGRDAARQKRAYAADAADAADAAYAAAKRDSVLSIAAEIAVEALVLCKAGGAAYLYLCK